MPSHYDDEKKPYEYSTIPGKIINTIRTHGWGVDPTGRVTVPVPTMKAGEFRTESYEPLAGVSDIPMYPEFGKSIHTATTGVIDWWRNLLGGTPPPAATPPAAVPVTVPTVRGAEEKKAASVTEPVKIDPTTGSILPMPDETRIPAIRAAHAAGKTFTNAELERYYGRPGVGEDYRRLWERAGQSPYMFGTQTGTGVVTEMTPEGAGRQRFSLPGGTVPIVGTRTKADIEDEKNLAAVRRLIGAQAPGGDSTAIPTGGVSPVQPGWLAEAADRLNSIRSELGGKMRKGKRAALVSEASNIMNALTAMSGHQVSYDVGMGNLDVSRSRALTDALTGRSQVEYEAAKIGAIPSEIEEREARAGLLRRQTSGLYETPEAATEAAIAEKRAGMKDPTQDIDLELIKQYIGANLTTEGLADFLKTERPKVLEALGSRGKGSSPIPTEKSIPPGAVQRAINKKTNEVIYLDKDGNPIK